MLYTGHQCNIVCQISFKKKKRQQNLLYILGKVKSYQTHSDKFLFFKKIWDSIPALNH